MQYIAQGHKEKWRDRVQSILVDEQLEACRDRLLSFDERGIFDDLSPLETELLFSRSYYASEGHKLSLEELRSKVLENAQEEVQYLSFGEDALVKRMLMRGGELELDDLDQLPYAESLIRRLFCTIAFDDEDEATLRLCPEIAEKASAAYSLTRAPIRELLFRVEAMVHSIIYLYGFVYAESLSDQLTKELNAKRVRISKAYMNRFLKSSFLYTYNREGRLFLPHPGLWDPERVLNEENVLDASVWHVSFERHADGRKARRDLPDRRAAKRAAARGGPGGDRDRPEDHRKAGGLRGGSSGRAQRKALRRPERPDPGRAQTHTGRNGALDGQREGGAELMRRYGWIVSPSEKKGPAFAYLHRVLPLMPQGRLHDAFRQKDVRMDGVRIAEDALIRPGAEMAVYTDYAPKLDVVYEDERLLLVNKPAGLCTEDEYAGMTVLSLVRDLADGAYAPRLCHRLDTRTSGLLLLCKDDASEEAMKNIFRVRHIRKEYECLARGEMRPPEGRFTAYLVKDSVRGKVRVISHQTPGAREIVTGYRLVRKEGELSRLRVELLTGRTHQIRAHLAYLNHPILGDDLYGDRELNRRHKSVGQLKLCAVLLSLDVPENDPFAYLNGREFTVKAPF